MVSRFSAALHLIALTLLLAQVPASALVGDIDGDGVIDGADNCPRLANPGQLDADADGYGDACDNCPATSNFEQLDTDGPAGAIVQWADRATASSEYSPTAYSAMQATGPPESPGVCGDAETNWSPADPVTTGEWIELRFKKAVLIDEAVVHESAEAGFVTRFQSWNTNGFLRVDLPVNDTTLCGDTWSMQLTSFDTSNRIRIWTEAPNWEEIDAVRLSGIGPLSPDGIGDACDTCPDLLDPDQLDGDGDGLGDPCDPCPLDATNDSDGDGVCDGVDPCPFDADDDLDTDGICGDVDNCVDTANPSQIDTDGDGDGNACDDDDDDDGLFDVDEPTYFSDPLDPDTDDDGLLDGAEVGLGSDPSDADSDDDTLDDGVEIELGTDPLDPDSDDDGSDDAADNCPVDANADQLDGDGDTVGDACDNCPSFANMDQSSIDGDAVGDACDNCPTLANCASAGGWEEYRLDPIIDRILDPDFGRSLELTQDGSRALLGAQRQSLPAPSPLSVTGAAYVFLRNDAAAWELEATLRPSDAIASSWYFGRQVAISGDGSVAAILAPGRSPGPAVYVFVRDGSAWLEAAILEPGGLSNSFGDTLALTSDGAMLFVGCPGTAGVSGSVHVYARALGWAQLDTLTASDPLASENFGRAIAASSDGTTLLASARPDAVPFGNAIHTLDHDGTTWFQTSVLLAGDRESALELSADGSVALAGDRPIQRVEIYERIAGVWTFGQILTPPWPATHFGHAAALSGDGSSVVIGANLDQSSGPNAGSAFVSVRNGSTWSSPAPLLPSVQNPHMFLGYDVSTTADGNTVLAGGRGAGSAWFFTLCQADSDGDDVGDLCDSCAVTADPGQLDLDRDGIGDACDEDLDGDGLLADDDSDDDGDGVSDVLDVCPTTPDPGQDDTDLDGVGDACDADDGLISGVVHAAPPPATASLLDWPAENGAVGYNVYAGPIATLTSGDGGSCLLAGLPRSHAVLDEPIAPGDGLFYLVAALLPAGEQTLGSASDGTPRTPLAACP